MALFPNSNNEYRGVMNAFWIEPAKRDVMGYKLTNVDNDAVIYPGTPIKTDEAAKTAVVCKYAYVVAVAADKQTLTVKEGHFFKAGAEVAISGANPLVQLTIESVTGDDTIKLSAKANSIKEGDVLVEVATTDNVVAPVALPNRVVCAKAEMNELDKTCSAAHEGIVLQNVVHYPKEYLNETTYPGYISLVGDPKLEFIIQ